jgi:YVTN family beta-propeller protein
VRYVDLYPGVDLEVTGQNDRLVQRLVRREDVSAQAASDPLSSIRWQVEGADALSLDNDNQLRLSTAIGDVTLSLPQLVTANGAPLDLSTTPQVNGLEITAPFSPTLPPSSPFVRIAASADLLFSTYLGGSTGEDAVGIGVDGAGGVYVTGLTNSIDFPATPGAFDPAMQGFFETYVAKLNPSGTALEYASYLGGDGGELTYDLAVDEAGHAFVTGYTRSPNFPITPGAYKTSISGLTDAFVIKVNLTGTDLEYSTYIGGNYLEWGYGLAIDESGSAYVSGLTTSGDFPTTPGAFQPDRSDPASYYDDFVVKLNPDGSALEYSTYLAGTDWDEAWDIAVDSAGNAYVTGYTASTDFPTTPGAFQTDFHHAFIIKLNPTGSDLVYGTFLGGSGTELGRGIAVDEAGHAYVTGDTTSSNFPTTPGAFQTTPPGGTDAFVVKLNPAGSALVYSTYLGGSDGDNGNGITIDSLGRAYVAGSTGSADFPTTPNAFQTIISDGDAFVVKLNAAGSGLAYSTFLGGSDGESGSAIAADEAGNAYIGGGTSSADFPTSVDAYDTTYDGAWSDAFITKLATGNEPEPPPPPTPVPAHTCAPTSLGTVTVGNEPRGLALDPVRQRLYVANFGSNSVSVVDTNSNTLIQTITGINSANGIAFDLTHNLIWVSNYNTGQVTPIQANSDATSFTLLPALTVGNGPWGVAYDPAHNYVYVANNLTNSVTVVNAVMRAVVTTLTGSFNQPFHLAPNPVTGKIYVSNFGNNSVTVVEGTVISRVVQLWDSGRPYGIAVDETRNLVYVATIQTHRIVVIGPIRGVPDQFYGWAAFHRGFGNPNRPVPLRLIAINPAIGPSGDGGHTWATTATSDGSEANQALFIPKGWGGYFHFPFAHNVGDRPADGLTIDRVTNRVYIASGTTPGAVTIVGDHAILCNDAYAHIASLEEGTPPAEDADQIGVEIFENEKEVSQPNTDLNGDSLTNILDLAIVASHYGSRDPIADLNADGQVNILDLAIVARNYHQ